MGWFLPLAKAVAPAVIGGFINNRAQQKAQAANQASSERQLQTLVADAEAAGFNPLTALRATGGQGYTVTHGGMSNAQFVSDAIGAGLQAIDPMERARDDLEYRLLEAQVTTLERQAGADPLPRVAAPLGRATGPMSYSPPNAMTTAPSLGRGTFNATEGDVLPQDPEIMNTTVTAPFPNWVRRPMAVDMEGSEAAYGEGVSLVHGMREYIGDAGHNWRLGNWPIQREWATIQQSGGFWQTPQFMRDNNQRNNTRMQNFGITTSP
jgi:hypothetical protein